ncbi:MAG: hypothetical protein JW909_05470 [Planctomycetes bacterium]|nr:hypothetical protein [Planctomycetota bacterium]
MTPERMQSALLDAARVASAMLDGEEASLVISPRAMRYIASPDPQFQFLSGDYYDVDHAVFLRMKKLLLRLETLLPFECAAKLWVPVRGLPGHVTLAVQNGAVNRYWKWAQEKLPVPPEMETCFSGGAPVLVPDDGSGLITVLAPLEDSLGDVVALVEITARTPKSRKRAPAWS